jgi:hypothetical protein
MADNSSRKFKFISPGVFIDEIDNSQLPATPAGVGPVVIGRAAKGPGMTPITVSSFSDFVETFGSPVAGNEGGDVWRSGKPTGPTYGAYAAQAWLRNNAPITYVRLLGEETTDASTAGKAGWTAGTVSADPTAGGAYGLFVFPSSSLKDAPATNNPVTGTLAATIYCTEGRVIISGSLALTGLTTGSGCTLFKSEPNGDIFLGLATGGTLGTLQKTRISLNPARDNFIRKVLNTNPTVTNDVITSAAQQANNLGGEYWLGESYENQLLTETTSSIGVCSANVNAGEFHCAILPLQNQLAIATQHSDRSYPAQKASTGWFLAQDLSTNSGSYDPASMQRLFRIESLTAGASAQQDLKVSIVDIKAPQGDFELYGTFGLTIRKMTDTDENPIILERYDGLNLNPASPNYVARVIGDQYEQYDQTMKLNRVYGQYANKSKYIRVAMDEDVDRGAHKEASLPFGVWGPLKYRNVSIASGSGKVYSFGQTAVPNTSASLRAASMVNGGIATSFGNLAGHQKQLGNAADNDLIALNPGREGTARAPSGLSASIKFPEVPLRKRSVWGNSSKLKNVYWGAWSGKSSTDTNFNEEVKDLLRPLAKGLQGTPYAVTHDVEASGFGQSSGSVSSDPLVVSWTFSLDDIVAESDGTLTYTSGSRIAGTSLSAVSSSYTGTLDRGADRFTAFLAGGSDGFDVTERDPFRLSGFTEASDENESYQLHSLKRAVNIMSDADTTQFNLITMPGITQEVATKHLLDTVEKRGDALAILDIRKVYTPDTETTESAASRNSFTIKQAVDQLKSRNINSSYGATYAPWVLIQDTVSNRTLWAPPSVVALGALSNTDRIAAPWFAPAGFQRGGLSEGAGGIPVLDVSKRLSSDDRDNLYEANINPIAKFPAEGIVIFGQKTLQQTASALDRINVRRLMVFLKREISFIASRLLFEQNTRDTWNRFTAQATPLLDSVKAQFGIDDFRLILDETTTTPDLIDRNIVYAKLLVKPTRSVEFFAIDFVITNSGASFED